MTPIYTYSNLKTRINAQIKGKIGVLISDRDLINQAAREVVSDIDLRSTRRKSQLSPPLFTDIFEYVCPTDLKDYKIINVEPQTDRKRAQYVLTTYEEFGRRRDANTIAISDANFIRTVLVNADFAVSDKVATISTMDSLTAGGGTWALFGDGTNLTADADNYVRGSGSINWDISAAAGTTAGIQNSGLSTFDLTDYLGGNGSAFVWTYITSTTGLTNFIIRLGSSSGAYYQKTTTTQADGTAFVAGWNLLRFDLTSLTTVGSPTNTAGVFVAIYMTKTAGKVSETDYRFDNLLLKKGEIHNLFYYSKFPWQTSAGSYIENSTVDSDLLNVDLTEFNLMVDKGVELAGPEVDEFDASDRAARRYAINKKKYEMANPSEALLIIETYADFIKM